MSNKIKKAQNRKNAAGVSKQGLLEMSMEYITAAIMAAMCIAVSFYAKDGYNQIGNAKFAAYRMVMLTGFPFFLAVGVVWLSVRLHDRRR